MNIKLNMLRSSMEDRIRGERNGTSVINPDDRSLRNTNRDFLKQRVILLCGSRSTANEERHQYEGGIMAELNSEGSRKRNVERRHEFLPKNYTTLANFIRLRPKAMLAFILGICSKSVDKIKEKKTKNIWSIQLMQELLPNASSYSYEDQYLGKEPGSSRSRGKSQTLANIDKTADFNGPIIVKESSNSKAERDNFQCKEVVKVQREGKGHYDKNETPILIAAKSGVVEMVAEILGRFPLAIHDVNYEEKNVILLAVEHRQPHVYKALLNLKNMTIFGKTDKDGNSALHIAAKLGEYRPFDIPGAALHMQWEIKWFEFVKNSMPPNFFPRHNNEYKTAREIFTESHQGLVKEGHAWLTSTSKSCFVVATLIATVAYPTFATLPGGVKSDNSGNPTLQSELGFSIFALSSLVALYFSVTSVIMFLAILTSRCQEKDFAKELPRKLLIGLTTLYISIGSMLLSFCAAHFFILEEKLRYAAFPMYAIMCLPVAFTALSKFPLYADLIWATMRKVPCRSTK